jgi:hypothetical protein
MARCAYGGKTTVESCRSVDVLHWSRLGLSLTGVQLVILDHALRLPVLRTLSLCTCCRHYPGAAAGRILAHLTSRISLPRKGRRVGLHIVLFEACSAFTRVTACTLALSPIRDPLIGRLRSSRHLHDCSDYFRLERLPDGTFTHRKSATFSRRTPEADI